MNKEKLYIFPLGGIEEIGSNCTCLLYKDTVMIVDMGITINSIDDLTPYLGSRIDIINFLLNEVKKKKLYILITHCHDDHVGGIAAIEDMIYRFNKNHNKDIKIEIIVSTKFNKDIIEAKAKTTKDYLFHCADFDNEIKIGEDGIKVKFLEVDHSIPDSAGIFFDFNGLTLFHTGDWKINRERSEVNTKYDYKTINKEKILKIMGNSKSIQTFYKIKDKCDILVGESTKAYIQDSYGDEHDVKYEIEKIIGESIKKHKKVYLTCFSSHIERIVNIIDIAIKHQLKVACMGHTIKIMLENASKNNIIPKYVIEYIQNCKKIEDLIKNTADIKIISGCQNESSSALHRIAYSKINYLDGRHVIIFSSSIIPNNRKRIEHLQKVLARKNVQIYNKETNPKIHCSGHADKTDIAIMYRIVQPKLVIPCHGNISSIRSNANLAQIFTKSKKIVTRQGNIIIVEKKIDGLSIETQSMRAHNNRNIMSLDNELFLENDPIINERKNLIQGGCIVINIEKKKIICIGTRIDKKIHLKINDKLEKINKISPEIVRKIIPSFKGEIVVI